MLTSKSWHSVLRLMFLSSSLALTTSSNRSSTCKHSIQTQAGDDVASKCTPCSIWMTTVTLKNDIENHLITLLSELNRGVAHLAVILAERFIEMRNDMYGQQISQKGFPLQQHYRRCIIIRETHILYALAVWCM